ncbi:MAG: GNAT family N-acetyltransferase [Ignavibacteriaceae bacterium]
MGEIVYKVENALDPSEFNKVLIKSTLAERRPVDDYDRIKKMCDNANLIVTARIDGKLIGVARSITDFAYCTYLSDLAVDTKYQNQGIGKKLIEETKRAAPQAKIILLSAPAAIDYYLKIGMKKNSQCFTLDDISELN